MKIKNLFKKSEVKKTNATVTKMDKTQLSKVVGGVDEIIDPALGADRVGGTRTGHIVGHGGNG